MTAKSSSSNDNNKNSKCKNKNQQQQQQYVSCYHLSAMQKGLISFIGISKLLK
jgi:hypothetical protein